MIYFPTYVNVGRYTIHESYGNSNMNTVFINKLFLRRFYASRQCCIQAKLAISSAGRSMVVFHHHLRS